MWVQFPSGGEMLSVEQQNFKSEYSCTLADGELHFTRVPDHLIPRVLSANLGYKALPKGVSPPGCDIADLAMSDPKRDEAVATLALQVDALTENNKLLTTAIERAEEQRQQAEVECSVLRALQRFGRGKFHFEGKFFRPKSRFQEEVTAVSLLNGDLTTVNRLENWLTGFTNPDAQTESLFQQLIGSMSRMIYSKINRDQIYSRTITRIFDGVGTYQLVLPDYPVTSVVSVQVGAALIPPSLLPQAPDSASQGLNSGYGYRIPPWSGNLPGENAVMEINNGIFWPGVQNIKISYIAGYLISGESQVVPSNPGPYTVVVNQAQGVWSRDNGVVYATSGIALVPVASAPSIGQYIPPNDENPGLYTFSSFDSAASLLISYSFIPADLEEACIQMVAERLSYRSRVGIDMKALGGQETVKFLRGGIGRRQWFSDLPPEVDALITPYINVVAPVIGAPV